MRLVHVVTVPMSLIFVADQVGYMKRRGFDVRAISSSGDELDAFGRREKVPVYAVEMARRITPVRDLVAVSRIYRYLRRIRPQIVHAQTPKGGLLGTMAAWMARVPVRIYHIHGLPLLTATGARRRLLRWTERVACTLAHQVLCVSHSVGEAAVQEGLCRASKIKVLRQGSANGVDAAGRYNPERWVHARRAIRSSLGISSDAMVVGFVGRIVRDKGILELVEVWKALREFAHLHLLLVGFFEPHDPLPSEVEASLRHDPRIHLSGRQAHAAPFYAAMDLVVLPSHREGFPGVPLEAAAMALPVVATRVPGCVDAVRDGVTGILVPPRDVGALADAIRRYMHDAELRDRHGRAGREWVLRDFSPEAIWQALYLEYVRLLHQGGLSVAATAASTNVPRATRRTETVNEEVMP